MGFSKDIFTDAASLPVRMIVRADMSGVQHQYQGETYWVIKDPLSLKFVRLTSEEYVILQLLNGKNSLADIRTAFENSFPHKSIRPGQIQQMLGSFHRAGLTLAQADGQGNQLYERRQKSFHQRLLQKSMNLLWLRFRGIDPERFLTTTYPLIRWVFHPVTVVACFLLMIMAGSLVLINANEFGRQLPSFQQYFSVQNIFLLTLSIALTKILHELGHAYACKHFGGECHEIGFLLLIMVPCLYCNTSDAWRLPNKWHRAIIGAAGIYVEVVLASLCTFLWWYSHPGVLHYLALNIMITSSISTVIFNGNPLLRYDGYYILSDVIEMPNLSTRSRAALIAVAKTIFLGMTWQPSQLLPKRHVGLFAVYALASTIYRWVVLVGILCLLTSVFRPYGMQALGQALIALTLVSSVMIPLWKAFQFFRVPGRIRQLKQRRMLIVLSIISCLLAVVFYVPLPCYIRSTAELQLDDSDSIYVSSGGRLEYAIPLNGPTRVAEGITLARLSNRQLELEVHQLEHQLAAQKIQLKLMLRTQRDRKSSQAIPTAQQTILDLSVRLAKGYEDLKQLNLVATRSGYIVLPSPRASRPAIQQLSEWSKTPLDPENQGCYLETGELLCQIGDPNRLKVILVIPQSSIKFITRGQMVQIKLDEYSGEILLGKITEISTLDRQSAPDGLSQQFGRNQEATSGEHPMTVSYEASVALSPHQLSLLPGFRGEAKIRISDQTLAIRASRYLHETFYFHL